MSLSSLTSLTMRLERPKKEPLVLSQAMKHDEGAFAFATSQSLVFEETTQPTTGAMYASAGAAALTVE